MRHRSEQEFAYEQEHLWRQMQEEKELQRREAG